MTLRDVDDELPLAGFCSLVEMFQYYFFLTNANYNTQT